MLNVKPLLAKILSMPHIIEQGTDGIWTYRKWSDGTAECWGIVSKTGHNINRAWGGMLTRIATKHKGLQEKILKKHTNTIVAKIILKKLNANKVKVIKAFSKERLGRS